MSKRKAPGDTRGTDSTKRVKASPRPPSKPKKPKTRSYAVPCSWKSICRVPTLRQQVDDTSRTVSKLVTGGGLVATVYFTILAQQELTPDTLAECHSIDQTFWEQCIARFNYRATGTKPRNTTNAKTLVNNLQRSLAKYASRQFEYKCSDATKDRIESMTPDKRDAARALDRNTQLARFNQKNARDVAMARIKPIGRPRQVARIEEALDTITRASGGVWPVVGDVKHTGALTKANARMMKTAFEVCVLLFVLCVILKQRMHVHTRPALFLCVSVRVTWLATSTRGRARCSAGSWRTNWICSLTKDAWPKELRS